MAVIFGPRAALLSWIAAKDWLEDGARERRRKGIEIEADHLFLNNACMPCAVIHVGDEGKDDEYGQFANAPASLRRMSRKSHESHSELFVSIAIRELTSIPKRGEYAGHNVSDHKHRW
jgi:hypothetical protein